MSAGPGTEEKMRTKEQRKYFPKETPDPSLPILKHRLPPGLRPSPSLTPSPVGLTLEPDDQRTSDRIGDTTQNKPHLFLLQPELKQRAPVKTQRANLRRKYVVGLQEQLDGAMAEQNGRNLGVCTIRNKIFSDAFADIICQVFYESPDRGELLSHVRDDLHYTVDIYRCLYESSVGFGERLKPPEGEDQKQLEYDDEYDMENTIADSEDQERYEQRESDTETNRISDLEDGGQHEQEYDTKNAISELEVQEEEEEEEEEGEHAEIMKRISELAVRHRDLQEQVTAGEAKCVEAVSLSKGAMVQQEALQKVHAKQVDLLAVIKAQRGVQLKQILDYQHGLRTLRQTKFKWEERGD